MNDRVIQNTKQNNTIKYPSFIPEVVEEVFALSSLLHYPVDITSEHVILFLILHVIFILIF